MALAGGLAAGAATAQANLTAETSGGASNHVAMVALGEIAAEQGLAKFQILDGQVLTNSRASFVAGPSDSAATPFILPFPMSRGAGPCASLGPEQGAEDIAKASVLVTGSFGGMVVATGMDDALAHALTRAFLDNLDRFEATAPIMKWVALGEVDPEITGLCGANPLRFHPAAVRAYADTGRVLPACALP